MQHLADGSTSSGGWLHFPEGEVPQPELPILRDENAPGEG